MPTPQSSSRAEDPGAPSPGDPRPPQAAGRGAEPSHYERLQVAPQASAGDLRQAFRTLSKRYHPDTTSLPLEQAEEAFRQLQQAYAVLVDPVSRSRYDALLQPRRPTAGSTMPMPPPLAAPRPVGVRRSLSGGEWFALLLLGLALVLSLVLGLGVAWARGAALVRPPSWWPEPTSSGGAAPFPAPVPSPPLDAEPAA